MSDVHTSSHTRHLVVEVFPEVLRHQAKQGQKGPTKGVKAGVAVVWVPSCLQTVKPIWALSATHTHTHTMRCYILQYFLSSPTVSAYFFDWF